MMQLKEILLKKVILGKQNIHLQSNEIFELKVVSKKFQARTIN